MNTLKTIIKSFLLFVLFFGIMAFLAKCEHDNSPVVNGNRVGFGYECHDGVLYVVSGTGMGRSIAPSFDSETGEVKRCSK